MSPASGLINQEINEPVVEEKKKDAIDEIKDAYKQSFGRSLDDDLEANRKAGITPQ